MSELSNPQIDPVAQHPLRSVIKELDFLLEKLRMELDVAPTDRKAHQDLLHRISRAVEAALQIPGEAWPLSPNFAEEETQELTKEELEFLESEEWTTAVEEGRGIDIDAINQRLKERGYQIQVSFPETPKD